MESFMQNQEKQNPQGQSGLPEPEPQSSERPLPLVSIILPVYNGQDFLAESINSILSQDYPNFELLVIDDGSSDGSASIARAIESQDDRLHFIKNDQNLGLIATLNKGISLAKGEYIGRIDSDDIWSSKDKLGKQMGHFASHPKAVIVGTWAEAIDAKGKHLYEMRCPSTDEDIRSVILIKNPFIHPSVVFRKEAALKAGGFMPDEKYVEDFGLWLRIGKFGTFANLGEPLMQYRIHAGSVTLSNNVQQVKNSLMIVKKNKGIYPGYWIGYIKWQSKFILLSVFGLSNFAWFKKLRFKITSLKG